MNRKIVNLVIAIFILYSFSMSGIAEDKSKEELLSAAINKVTNDGQTGIDIVPGETLGTVEHGDLVTVRYYLKDDNGNGALETITLLAGEVDTIPAIHSIVKGMKPGETKSITLSPEEAYGPLKADRIMTMPLKKVIEMRVIMPVKEFVKKYSYEPQEGVKVGLVPYFTHTVANVENGEATLYADVTAPFSADDGFGKVAIIPDKDTIQIILEPKLGALFRMGSNNGYIASSDKESFSVDFNHPLAGKILVLNVTIDNLIKKSDLDDDELLWSEDYIKAVAEAGKTEKPVVMIFFKEGCPWCEKLFDETMEDPRVIYLNDKIVWKKIDGEKASELADSYGVESYPSILFLNSKGEVIEKTEGYQAAPVLRDWLNSALNKWENTPVKVSDAKTIIKN